jgi:hypothetical protein
MHSIKKNVKETVQSGMGKTGKAVKSPAWRKGNDRPVYCWISEFPELDKPTVTIQQIHHFIPAL